MKIYDYKGRKNLCGDRVREARARKKITQTDLAARLQVAGVIMERDSVSRIEIVSIVIMLYFSYQKTEARPYLAAGWACFREGISWGIALAT